MRTIVLMLSVSSVLLFSYAVAGMGGFLFGRGRLDYIALGLFGGGGAAAAALWLWRRWLVSIDLEASSEEGTIVAPPDDG
ncbi:MAG: hypothetical protein GX181_08490 [Synergistaceae bacterium]|nr:hypothetical protein [Synergistaceae bacterium]